MQPHQDGRHESQEDLVHVPNPPDLDDSGTEYAAHHTQDSQPPRTSSFRSLFSSGVPSTFTHELETPTSDITRVSTDATSSSSAPRPLQALASASSAMSKRMSRLKTGDEGHSSTPITTQIARAQKAVDDPTTPPDARKSAEVFPREYNTTSLSKLFSRTVSDAPPPRPFSMRNSSESSSLPNHLYTRGLLEGRHSDITVAAFGEKYKLHRLILDRAPFFSTALCGPWIESRSEEMTLHPEEIDSNITQASFELTIKRLYGVDITEEEDAEAVGLFATGCWLEIQDLIDSSIESILRQMSPETLAPLIRLVTSNYYGRSGDRILASAKSMLCRNGWEMSLKNWDGIPGDVIREIVAGDGFFVPGEWHRWVLAKRLLDRRLRQAAIQAGLAERGKEFTAKAPQSMCLMAVRFDAVYRQNSFTVSQPMADSHATWLALYTNPDIERILVLLDEGIHYIHLEFEQLEFIKGARDVLGLPVMPEKVISNALWQQLALRQRVLSADEEDQELGLSQEAKLSITAEPKKPKDSPISKGKEREGSQLLDQNDDMESGSWDGNGKPRKFWIPSCDCNIVLGNGADPVVTTSSSFQRHATRISSTLQPEDAQWATDFGSSPGTVANPNTRTDYPARPTSASGSNAGQPKPFGYTEYPPFRFSAEFPNPRLLKEKKRVYSRTVSYAGSLWNIYIQKVRSAKSVQLGVYLHRAKEREAEDATGGVSQQNFSSVDERIGQLEREMLLRSERRERRRNRLSVGMNEEDTSGSGGDPDATLIADESRNSIFNSNSIRRRPLTSNNFLRSSNFSSSQLQPLSVSPPSDADPILSNDLNSPTDVSDDSSDSDPEITYPNPSLVRPIPVRSKSGRSSASTLPPYIDGRPTIKTYFKIYSPSKGGRMLSVYESAPDRFNFSQSWGWKSSTLMLDEIVLSSNGDVEGESAVSTGKKKNGDGKLRFMVVIGNL